MNTEVELLVLTKTEDGADQWSDVTVVGPVSSFPPGDLACEGGVGLGLGDESAHIEISWSGERFGESGVRLMDVAVNVSKRFVTTWPPIPT